VAITMTPGGATVYDQSTNPPGGTIQLDPAATDPAGSTVHEAGHAEAHNEHRDADTQTQSRADYIDTQLREDAHNERMAYENEQQLADNGTPEPYNSSTSGRYHSAYTADETAYRAAHPDASEAEVRQHANDAAEAAILQDYRNGTINTGNTTPPQSYVNYWGQAYDGTPGAGSHIPPH